MSKLNQKTALLLIDYQEGFRDPKWGEAYPTHADENAAKLLQLFRAKGLPVFHVQHLSKNPESPLRPGQPGVEFMKGLEPRLGERIFQKHVNSAFIGTDLEAVLKKEGIETLVILGVAVDHCVSTTTRMAANLGFQVTLVADATLAHDRVGFDGKPYDATLIHQVSLASLHGEFADVATTANLLDRLGSFQ